VSELDGKTRKLLPTMASHIAGVVASTRERDNNSSVCPNLDHTPSKIATTVWLASRMSFYEMHLRAVCILLRRWLPQLRVVYSGAQTSFAVLGKVPKCQKKELSMFFR
jgi:hypothetical protein